MWGEAIAQGGNHVGGLGDRERGLGDEAQPETQPGARPETQPGTLPAAMLGSRRLEGGDVVHRLDQRHLARRELAHRADHLRVTGMADQDDVPPLALVAHGLLVDLGDQRTGGVEIKQVARLGIGRHRFRHAVGGEDDGLGRLRHLIELLDEHRAHVAQALHHMRVVDDLVAHVDGRTVFLERQHDDLDGAVHAGAEAAGTAQAKRCGGERHEREIGGFGVGRQRGGPREKHRPPPDRRVG